MKSKLYKKYRASKYTHKTHSIPGSGNTKGELVVGTKSALQEINQERAKNKLPSLSMTDIHHIEHNKGQWIFCVKKSRPLGAK